MVRSTYFVTLRSHPVLGTYEAGSGTTPQPGDSPNETLQQGDTVEVRRALEAARSIDQDEMQDSLDDYPSQNVSQMAADSSQTPSMADAHTTHEPTNHDTRPDRAPDSRAASNEQDMALPNADQLNVSDAMDIADAEGERRDLPYIIYRACRAIGYDMSHPALATDTEGEDSGRGSGAQLATRGRGSSKRGSSKAIRRRRPKRPSSDPVEQPAKKKPAQRPRQSSHRESSDAAETSPAEEIPAQAGGGSEAPRRSGRARVSTDVGRER